MIVNSRFNLYSSSVFYLKTDEKLPPKASNSLPEFFQEEFPTFQKFIDLYYRYMSRRSEGYKGMSTIADIDEIGRKYLSAFYKMYAKDMPEFPYIGMADFIRNSRSFYVSRGSEDSFRFLFKIMFGEELEFKYPKENIFAGSIGKWNQPVSIYVEIEQGTLTEEIIGRKLLIKALDESTSSFIVKSIKELSPSIFEVEVDNFIRQNVVDGATVFAFLDSQTLQYKVKGKIRSGVNRFTVINPGVGFLVGQVYSVMSPEGEITFRITSTNEMDGIKQIEFINFAGVASSGFTENIKSATIQFELGTVNTYTGYYENTDGFLSNQSKLEDNYFYQIFSYVIKSKVSRELYIDLIDKILHPTGLISFSEYEVGSEYQNTITGDNTWELELDILDSINIYDNFERIFLAERDFSDTVEITDSSKFTLHKILSDNLNTTDSGDLELWKAGHYTTDGYTVGELYTTDELITDTWSS